MQDDPLSQMRDVHLPDVPGFWPPAPGWWLLAAILLIMAALLVRRLVQKHRQLAPRRAALELLQQDFAACSRGELAADEAAHRANALLKRLWVHVDGQHQLTALSGPEWLAYLDRRSGTHSFSEGPGQLLGSARFAREPARYEAELYDLLRKLLNSEPPPPAEPDTPQPVPMTEPPVIEPR